MSINMGYVKFENTLAAMRECFEDEVNYSELSDSEKIAFDEMVKLCTEIYNTYGA